MPYRDKIVGIYTITNIVNGKIYVGYSRNCHKRLSTHRRLLRNNTHQNKHLQVSYNKYGKSKFKFEVLIECLEEHLCCQEHYWCILLDTHNNKHGYNNGLTDPNGFPRLFSPETIKRMSEARSKYYLTHPGPTTGRIVTQETRAKLSKASKGRKHTKETREQMSKAHLGVKKPRNKNEK